VYLGYVTPAGSALADFRLYLPRAWARDRARRQQCGVPAALRYASHPQLGRDLVRAAGPELPHAWLVSDVCPGASRRHRRAVRALGRRCLVAVSPGTTVRAAGTPGDAARAYVTVAEWARDLEPGWRTIQIGEGEHRQRVEVAVAGIVARERGRRTAAEETL